MDAGKPSAPSAARAMLPDPTLALLRHRSFAALLVAQFLGAFNDNLYKMVVSLMIVGAALASGDGGGTYLSLAGAVFVAPYILFSGYAGYLADTFDKRAVLVTAKTFEIAVMALALGALVLGRVDPLLAVLFLMAIQSTFFSPAKYGIVPEMLPEAELSRANGLMEMGRYVAIIVGTACGGLILAIWPGQPAKIGFALVAIACAGALASYRVRATRRPGPRKPFRPNPWGEIADGLRRLGRDRTLGPAVAGITYFEFIGTLVLLDVILVGKEVMGLDDLATGMLGAFAGLGIGVGSFVAGRLSGDKVELGLVPFGAIGVGLTLLALPPSTHSYALFTAVLALVGFWGGLVAVPFYSLLQQRAGVREKGHLMATNNFANMAGVLAASGALWLLREVFDIPADSILLIAGTLTLAVTIAALRKLPEYVLHAVMWVIDRGRHRPPRRGARTGRLRRIRVRALVRVRRYLALSACHGRWVRRGRPPR